MEMNDILRSVLDNLSQPVIIINRELTIIYSNKSRIDHYKSPDYTVVGKKCYEVTHGFENPCQASYVHPAKTRLPLFCFPYPV